MYMTTLTAPWPLPETTPTSPYHLTPEQIRFFDDHGYLVLRQWIPSALLARLRDAGDAWIDAGMQATEDELRGNDFLFAERPGGRVMYRVNYLHNKGQAASLELLGSPQVLAVAESLCGPNFVPTYESMVFKQEGDGEAIPWHQDAVHPRGYRIFNFDLYLDSSRVGAGALRVVPRSQIIPNTGEHLWYGHFGPPMKEGVCANDLRLLAQATAAFRLCLNQAVQITEALIHQRFIAQSPQPFRWLHLRRICWLKYHMHALRYHHGIAAVPAGLIDHQHDLLALSRPDCRSKLGQHQRPHCHRDPWQQQPEALPTVRTHKPVQIGPFVARLNRHKRTLPFLAPDPPQDRLEADAMFILAPDFHTGVRMLGLDLGDGLRKRFF
jgi:hypothetical protein